jgi:hypothetical protein
MILNLFRTIEQKKIKIKKIKVRKEITLKLGLIVNINIIKGNFQRFIFLLLKASNSMINENW